ncbi:MAG: hypothetical protein IH939_20795 [Acidobacteria bacterium]|nr:hypothetical protein [Acidobacteriota bacterium]
MIHVVIAFREGHPEINPRNRMLGGLKEAGRFREGAEETIVEWAGTPHTRAARTALDHAIAELRNVPYRSWYEVVTNQSSFTKPFHEGPGRLDIDASWHQGTRAIDVTITLTRGWRRGISDGFTITPTNEFRQQSVVKVARRTEGGAAPVWQGGTREQSRRIRPRNNTARPDVAPAECSGTFTTGC